MVWLFERMTTDCVAAPPLKKRTPLRKSPLVTPVAANTTWPRAISSSVKILFGSVIPILRARSARTHGELVHVRVGRVQQVPLLRHGNHAERVGSASGGDRRSLERIERDVHLGILGGATADLLADVEHGRFVALAFADHDRS